MEKECDIWDGHLYTNKHSYVYKYGSDLIGLLNPQKGETILDLGCGTGQLTQEISQVTPHVYGMDSSENMVRRALTLFPHLDFKVGNAVDFEYLSKFDAIFSNATLHWVLDYKAAIKSMYRNLKKNGRLVLEMGGKGNVQTILNQLRKTLKSFGYVKQSETEIWFFPSIGEYSLALEKVGFVVEFAQLFDRPTKLDNPTSGIIDWLTMFAKDFFQDIDEQIANQIKVEVQDNIKEKLTKDGELYADYKRLRIFAVKKPMDI